MNKRESGPKIGIYKYVYRLSTHIKENKLSGMTRVILITEFREPKDRLQQTLT
jgi:hypothetical protein